VTACRMHASITFRIEDSRCRYSFLNPWSSILAPHRYLFLASLLSLFLELMLIPWVPSQVRVVVEQRAGRDFKLPAKHRRSHWTFTVGCRRLSKLTARLQCVFVFLWTMNNPRSVSGTLRGRTAPRSAAFP
jgi:hypothetical protein